MSIFKINSQRYKKSFLLWKLLPKNQLKLIKEADLFVGELKAKTISPNAHFSADHTHN